MKPDFSAVVATGVFGSAVAKVTDLVDTVSDIATNIGPASKELAEGLSQLGREASAELRPLLVELGQEIAKSTTEAAGAAVDYVKENPGKTAAAVGGIALAGVGAAAAVAAAPAIGAAVSAAGFGAAGGTISGAAASSAGLAALGGGSLAAGGAGVAGGTVVCGVAGGVAAGVGGAAVSAGVAKAVT